MINSYQGYNLAGVFQTDCSFCVGATCEEGVQSVFWERGRALGCYSIEL